MVVGVAPPLVDQTATAGCARGTRRQALGAALCAAGALVVGAALAACGPTAADLSAAAANPVVLTWLPWTDFPNGTTPSAASLMREGLRPWLLVNRGVQVDIAPPGSLQGNLAAMLAGEGPDVFHDAVLPPYVEQNLLYNIQPYLASDHIDLSRFLRTAVDSFASAAAFAPAGGGYYCLPAFINTLGMAVNVQALDAAGLSPPEPGWTYQQWASLWRSASNAAAGARHVYGGNLAWTGYDNSGSNPAPFYLKGFGGEYVDPLDATRCFLDQPGSIAALRWCYDLGSVGAVGGDNRADIAAGRQISGPLGTSALGTSGDLVYAAQNWRGLKWAVLPMPLWPQGAATSGSSDFYAISSGTKAPDLAWSLLRFLCVEADWQNFMTTLALLGPNQKALWQRWQETVLQYASPLAAVNLGVFTEAVQSDLPYVGLSFKFNDAESAAAIKAACAPAQTKQVSVELAARQATARVDALQAQGGLRLQRAEAALRDLRRSTTAAQALRAVTGP